MESEERYVSNIITYTLVLTLAFLPLSESYSCNIEIPDKWCIGSPDWIHNLADCPNKPVIPDAEPVTIEIRVIYKCKNSGKLFDGSNLYAEKTCSGNGSDWMGTVDPCKDIDCRAPPSVDNATFILTNTSLNGQATYSCDTGFELHKGDSTLTCMEDGKWFGTPPTCRKTICPALTQPQNGIVCASSNLPGGKAEYTCAAGYRLLPGSGDATRTCGADGKWSGAAPTCEQVTCPTPETISYTTMQSTGKVYGEKTMYTCIGGYKSVKGESERICQANKTWSGEKLVCERVECKRPLVLPKSSMSPNKTRYVFEDFIRYQCEPGYEKYYGDLNRNCQKDGTWSGSPPYCQEIKCPKLAGLPHTSMTSTGNSVGDVIIYACTERHQMTAGDKKRACLENATWSGSPPTCEVSICPKPVENVHVKRLTPSTAFRVNDTLEYACDTGYKQVAGNATRTCLRAGTWSGTPLVCQEISCPCIIQPPASVITVSKHTLGGVATFLCLPGYAMTRGDTKRTCNHDGTWSGTPPNCTKVKCPMPSDVPNTYKRVQGLNSGQTVSYTCHRGYKLVRGDLVWSCRTNGLWSGDVPICDVISCPKPEVIPRARLLTTLSTYVVNTTIQYVCQDGYEVLSGHRSRICQHNGVWSGTPIFCQEVNCQNVTSIPNGTFVSSGRSYGDIVAYMCANGFFLSDGSPLRHCLPNKTWTGKQPTCTAVTCPSPPTVLNALPVSPKSEYILGEVVTYECKTGHEHTGGDQKIRCLTSRTWSDKLPICTEISCPDPPGTPNGNVTVHGKELGDVATYHCDTGYTPVGDVHTYCQANKTWSDGPPRCKEIFCPTPSPVQFGDMSSKGQASYTLHDNVTFACQEGYNMSSGDATRYCQKSGRWSGTPPICTAVECPVPPDIPNTTMDWRGREYGDLVFYRCNPGYKMSGGNGNVIVCQSNGTWFGVPLQCSVVQCAQPAPVLNAILSATAGTPIWNSTVNYTCLAGHTLSSGQLIRTCARNGTWSGTPPLCRAISCGPPDTVNRSTVIISGQQYGSIAFYRCNEGYKLTTGDERRTCQANGTWSGLAPSCEPFSCNAPPLPSHVKVTSHPPNYDFHSKIQYECGYGYEQKAGNMTRVCESNSRWSGNPPECQEIRCGPLRNVSHTSMTSSGEHYRAMVVYSCDEGYSHTGGDMKRMCLANGTWSGVPPTCGLITCPDPMVFSHSTLSQTKQKYLYKDKVRYSCEPGHQVAQGNAERECLAQGMWSGIPLLCEAIRCGKPEIKKNTKANGFSTIYGSSLSYQCDTLYRHQVGDTIRTCQANGKWSGSVLDCQRIQCPTPTNVSRADVFYSGVYPGDTAIYLCHTGLKDVRSRMTILECLYNGTWSDRPPECPPIVCEVPENVNNSERVFNSNPNEVTTNRTEFAPWENVTYVCNDGYAMEGSAFRECLAHGTWSGRTPVCRRIDCGFPQCARFSNLFGEGIKYGDKVSYECFADYLIIAGDGNRTCLSNGKWSGRPPQCTRIPVIDDSPPEPPKKEKKVGKKLVYPSIDAERAPEIGMAIIGVSMAFVGLIFFLDISTYYRNLRTMKKNVSHFIKSRRDAVHQKQRDIDMEEWGEGARQFNGVAKLSTNNSLMEETPSTSTDDSMVQLKSCKYATRMNTTRPVGTENLSVL